jgi:hypothetical protein
LIVSMRGSLKRTAGIRTIWPIPGPILRIPIRCVVLHARLQPPDDGGRGSQDRCTRSGAIPELGPLPAASCSPYPNVTTLTLCTPPKATHFFINPLLNSIA